MSEVCKTLNCSVYDELPLAVIIYQILYDSEGSFLDYRIVYGNQKFADDYHRFYQKENFIGACAEKDHLVDDYSLQIMKSFQHSKARAFSTYIPHINMHVHMQPITNMPEGYLGFIVTDVSDFDEQESRIHFLRVVSQMNNNACLYQQNEDGSLNPKSGSPFQDGSADRSAEAL